LGGSLPLSRRGLNPAGGNTNVVYKKQEIYSLFTKQNYADVILFFLCFSVFVPCVRSDDRLN